jgi:hypothetical protein
MKKCAMCSEVKPLSDFHRQPSGPMGRHSYCKPCANQKQRETRVRRFDPAKKRKWILWTRYRMTPEQWEELAAKQGNKCPVCQGVLTKELRPCVDHDHKTGAVRGILCHRCNVSIYFLEDADRYSRAIEYLRGAL